MSINKLRTRQFISSSALGTPGADILKRLFKLQTGLLLFGLGTALIVQAHLGSDPWSAFHLGMSSYLAISISLLIQITGAFFLLISVVFLRQRIGFGSICNMLLVGPWFELFQGLIPSQYIWWQSMFQLLFGIIVLGFATALYITADFGAGPRDGLVLGLAKQSGFNVRYVRTATELMALGIGYWLGGAVGIGTLIFALSIGPFMQFFLSRLKSKESY